jgi:heparosan-N-sulfate-glucuronate 5-epimerase
MPMTATAETLPIHAGMFSSWKRFALPLGSASDPQTVRGYPIDLRLKAQTPSWPPVYLPAPADDFVCVAQFGLGCFERWLAGEGEQWLGSALDAGRFLIGSQQPDGSWLNQAPLRHTFPMSAPWRCAMAQGESASLLVRLYLETGEEAFASSAVEGLRPLSRPRQQAGTCARLDGDPWPEEYPTEPPSFVLNGAIFAWWGMRDVAMGLGDSEIGEAFERGVDVLAQHLHRFDTGWWSLYCLYPHPLRPIASSFYHALHITQLEAMHRLAPRDQFETTRRRWIGYFDSALNRRRAFAKKVLYRLVVPRNRMLGDRLPWIHHTT